MGLGIHRETVGRHLRLADSKPAIPLTGSEAVLELKPSIALTGYLAAGRQSLCMPLQAMQVSLLTSDTGRLVE